MGLFLTLFGTREERVLKTCTRIYNKTKKMRPGRNERDYLKFVLITKPPFDYQYDQVLDYILDSCSNIRELSKMISEQGKGGSHLWKSRERNVRLGALKNRNKKFFSEFWEVKTKKVKIRDYCYKKYDFIFSEAGKKIMDDLLVTSGISLDKSSKNNYYSNFIAAYFELVGVAFSRTITRELRYEVLRINSEYLKEKNASHIDALISIYNSAFGSSFQDGIRPMADGIRPMAQVISGKIIAEKSSHIEDFFYDTFYGIIEAFFTDLKGMKLTS